MISPLRNLIAFLFASSVIFTAHASKPPVVSPQILSSSNRSNPNILLIYIDDLGWSDLSCYGNEFTETPHIDRLANEGILFTQAYSASHICSPARASLMTGKTPARLHITDWIPGHDFQHEKLRIPDWQQSLPFEEITIGEMLKEAGYTTAWIGKWHLSGLPQEERDRPDRDHRTSNAPLYHGFDAGGQNWRLNGDENQDDPKGVMTLTREALAFIAAAKEQPWFLGLSHYSVHTPIHSNDAVKDRYESKLSSTDGPTPTPKYAGMLEALDQSVGHLMAELEKRSLEKNTLVLFYSDNGGLDRGNGTPTTNAPLRESKGTLYEGGTRVPFIVRWPGKIKSGTVSEERIYTYDFLPTFAEAAGIDTLPENLDGISFLATLLEQAPLAERPHYWHYPHYHQGMPGSSILDGDYKLIEFFHDNRIELYNLSEDLGERHNLVEEEPAKALELLQKLNAWRYSVGAQFMSPNPNYDPAKAKRR